MGVDLSLLPFEHEEEQVAFTHSVLKCARSRNLAKEISRLDASSVPSRFSTHISRNDDYPVTHHGNTQKDAYGQDLKYVFAEELTQFSDHEHVRDNARNRAVWAYLGEIPKDTKVALFWS